MYDDPGALRSAVVDLLWALAMLGQQQVGLAKECVAALSLVPVSALSHRQLSRLWAAQMRHQQLGHRVLDPNPLLPESYTAFARQVGAYMYILYMTAYVCECICT